jgi:hypothetical protein
MIRRIALTLVSGVAIYTLAVLLSSSQASHDRASSAPVQLAARSGYIVASS